MGDIMSQGREKEAVGSSLDVQGESRNTVELEGEDDRKEERDQEEGKDEDNVAGSEHKELAVELEEILKTCNQIKSKPETLPPDTSEFGWYITYYTVACKNNSRLFFYFR